jgi:hypothetical protein
VQLGSTQKFASPGEALAHISEKAWSEYKKSDYTIEQWHTACLIHTHDGDPTSKGECKLPVKTPDGALNRNGVHAAAAALAGARGGLKGVSDEQKKKAAAALKRYYGQLDEDPPDSLTHYGVKGMHWGVRKKEESAGPFRVASSPQALAKRNVEQKGRVPAPMPQATKPVVGALSEKKQAKVDKFLQRADVMSTTSAQLKKESEALKGSKNPAKAYSRYANTRYAKELDRSHARALKDAEAVKKGKLTSTQKKLLLGAAAVGVIGAGVAISRGQQSGALNSYALRGAALLRGQKSPFAVNKELAGKMSASELLEKVAKPVNPGYSKAGGKMNCRRSTYAYELRRRGFDVHATTSAAGWGQSESGVINALTPGSRNFYRSMSMSQAVVNTGRSSVASGDRRSNPVKKILLEELTNHGEGDAASAARVLKNVKAGRPIWEGLSESSRTVSSSKRVLEELAKQPNGSRGEVLFKFPNFGHSMAYEVVDGVPHIFDSQKGTLYNAATKMVESKWDGFTAAEITRLDNIDLDLNFLSRWATNVGGK